VAVYGGGLLQHSKDGKEVLWNFYHVMLQLNRKENLLVPISYGHPEKNTALPVMRMTADSPIYQSAIGLRAV
jgi:hypothetical protein